MAQNNDNVVDGRVIESLPGNYFLIKLVSPGFEDIEIRAKLSGRMKTHRIKIIMGDWVQIELNPHNLEEGRIVYRPMSAPSYYKK